MFQFRAICVMCLVGAAFFAAKLVQAQIPDPCDFATVRLNAPVIPCPLLACPQGDTPSFASQGWTIEVWVRDINGIPISGVPANDFWLIDCDPLSDASLCGGSASSNADHATNSNGKTTLSLSTLAGGGCADGISVVVQGIVLVDSLSACTTFLCLPINLRSPDIDGSLEVNLIDLSTFAASYPPAAFDRCCDYDIDGEVNLTDLAEFASHYGPPGHSCF